MSPMTILIALAVAATAAPLSYAACADGGDGAMLHGVANDVLMEYGLPKGLLPDSVKSYTFENATGDYHIELASSCYTWFGEHYVYFDKNLSGTISHGALSNLSGVMAKKLFIWVSITSMVVHMERGMIEFHAGFITEDVPASLFEKIPVCENGVGEPLRGAAGVIRELGLLPVAEVSMRRGVVRTYSSSLAHLATTPGVSCFMNESSRVKLTKLATIVPLIIDAYDYHISERRVIQTFGA